MINQLLSRITKKDIEMFKEYSPFFLRNDFDPQYGNIVYYRIKTFGYPNKLIPDNFEIIGRQFISLGIIQGEIIRKEDLIIIYNFNIEALPILEKILFDRNKRNNLLLEKIINKLNLEGIGSFQLNNEFKINYSIKNFTDTEILIHAISIEQPDLLKEIEDFKENNKNLKNNNIKRDIKYVIIKKYGLYDDKGNIIFTFNKDEGIIAKELKNKGMSLENLKKITKQNSTNAVSSSIKVIQKNIKENMLTNYIELSYSRSERVYNLKILKI